MSFLQNPPARPNRRPPAARLLGALRLDKAGGPAVGGPVIDRGSHWRQIERRARRRATPTEGEGDFK